MTGVAVSVPADPGRGSSFWARNANGQVFGWGENRLGQLGLGPAPAAAPVVEPADLREVVLPFGSADRRVRAGGTHTLFLEQPGRYVAAGNNDAGQLGTGGYDASWHFARVDQRRGWP